MSPYGPHEERTGNVTKRNGVGKINAPQLSGPLENPNVARERGNTIVIQERGGVQLGVVIRRKRRSAPLRNFSAHAS